MDRVDVGKQQIHMIAHDGPVGMLKRADQLLYLSKQIGRAEPIGLSEQIGLERVKRGLSGLRVVRHHHPARSRGRSGSGPGESAAIAPRTRTSRRISSQAGPMAALTAGLISGPNA